MNERKQTLKQKNRMSHTSRLQNVWLSQIPRCQVRSCCCLLVHDTTLGINQHLVKQKPSLESSFKKHMCSTSRIKMLNISSTFSQIKLIQSPFLKLLSLCTLSSLQVLPDVFDSSVVDCMMSTKKNGSSTASRAGLQNSESEIDVMPFKDLKTLVPWRIDKVPKKTICINSLTSCKMKTILHLLHLCVHMYNCNI